MTATDDGADVDEWYGWMECCREVFVLTADSQASTIENAVEKVSFREIAVDLIEDRRFCSSVIVLLILAYFCSHDR